MEETFKFEIGQWVRVTHPNFGTWTGKVYNRSYAPDEPEYWVTGAPAIFPGVDPSSFPVLAWECEMEAIEAPVAANE